MLPFSSTAWVGMVTKLPARTPASAGINKPPAADSKIVTLTESPIPKRNDLGGVLAAKAVESLGVYCPRIRTTSGFRFTSAYGKLATSPPTCPVRTSKLCGPLVGRIEHPANGNAKSVNESFAQLPAEPNRGPPQNLQIVGRTLALFCDSNLRFRCGAVNMGAECN